jgi:hypothetical protein
MYPRPEIPQPECICYEQDGKVLTITRRWFSLRYVPLAFFTVVWDLFLVLWFAMNLGAEGAHWLLILFPIIYITIGIVLTYFTLAVFINHTELEVTADLFKTSHGPLPWFGKVTLPTREITQFYSKHILGNKGMFAYELLAITQDRRSHRVLRYLETPDIPLFLEQHIEKWLKLKDIAVSGELPRK